uniref:receptor-type tyrosine-protein phosphatase eta isoform X2 n=1 Tax=Gasterosteus aculeatus aculeatus TaxID=481459 RepID=UPI001A9949CB|nr:receptor-type tyrosine-protein phosphatase eta isoform X2 [Gasterosteus aculeatus aculeatus]
MTVSWKEAVGLVGSYAVLLFRDNLMVKNVTDLSNFTTNVGFTDLIPGVLYCVEVVTTSGPLMNAASRVCNATWPAAVSGVTAIGNTTAMTVSWKEAVGLVGSYAVLLFRDNLMVKNVTDLSNFTTNVGFTDLIPGVLSCVEVVTTSGPLMNAASRVCNATWPAAVSGVTAIGNTTAMTVSWKEAVGLVGSYAVLLFRDNLMVKNVTDLSNFTTNVGFTDLIPGVLYCVEVVTTSGPLMNAASRVCNATWPAAVSGVTAIGNTTAMTVSWKEAVGLVGSYAVLLFRDNLMVKNVTDLSNFTTNVGFTDLIPGVLYCVEVVTTSGPLMNAASRVCNATWPAAVSGVTAIGNTTAMTVSWKEAVGLVGSYAVLLFRDNLMVKNVTDLSNFTTNVGFTDLIPGVLYCVEVVTTSGPLMNAASRVCNATWPAAVSGVTAIGNTTAMTVSWKEAVGLVGSYAVLLFRDNLMVKNVTDLSNFTTNVGFTDLIPGVLYCVEVVTTSGPLMNAASRVCNATFPNPPGPIMVESQTVNSINFTWPFPGGMDYTQYNFSVSSHNGSSVISKNWYVLQNLESGSPYNLSVVTVGVLHYESTAVTTFKYTRPLSVNNLTTSTEEDSITVMWEKPDQYKESYCYILSWHSSDESIRNTPITRFYSKINDLVPGKQYNISVTTETVDGTEGAPIWISVCTNAGAVKDLICDGPDTTIAQVILSWKKNNGQNSGFKVTVNNGETVNYTHSCCNYTVSNLRHNTSYNLSVETQSCGLPSRPETRLCWTGITNPPIPKNYQDLVVVTNKEYNKFSLQIKRGLLDSINGPITHVGVLVTQTDPGASDLTTYVSKTYQEWKEQATQVYMATVKNLTETTVTSRSEEGPLDIEIGSENKWGAYFNGPLEANEKYQYAIVLFTRLTLDNQLVTGKLLAATKFYNFVQLPQNPVVISIAIGVTLGIFCVLLIILIGFIIYWKRLSNKDSPDIQIHSLRAKVSVAVRVEEFEAYYKKQKADSSCGFAEEFEDMKLVGTAQSKTQALTLENKPKNRYNNVLPYDSSRVKLSIIHGSPYEDYINANYMPGYNSRKEYIAAQGPLPATVNEFWRMIWEKNVQTLVMLTRCNEQGRVKCEQYWDHGTKHFDKITVTTSSEIELEDWTIRDFYVKNVKTAETRLVRHFHFTAWPDHGVPQTTELLISFRHLVREHMDQYSRNSPTVVHCSAGVGRTGTFITIDRLIFQIERENLVDVYGIVHDLRMHRPLMVQTEDQYVFLNQCALDIIRSRTGNNVDLIYQNSAAMSIYENIDPTTGYLRA